METTQEKTMQNEMMETSMCEESMDKTVDDSMTEMEAVPKKSKLLHKDVTIGLIDNYIIELGKELKSAKLRYAEADLDDENWSGKYERRTACKVIEGKIKILTDFQSNLESMFASMSM